MNKLSKIIISSLCFLTSYMMMPAENIVSKDFYPAENIKTISIELSYENLEIKTTNGSDILVEIASNNSKKIPEIFLEANNFIIKSRKNQKWNTGNICTVYVYLPNDFFSKTTNIKVASGEIYIDNLETDELKVSSASGDIKIIFSNVTNEIELSAASGKIEFNTGKTRKFSATTSSGDIFVQQLISKEIWCKVASGEVDTENIECEYLSVQTSSGDIDCSKTTCQYFDIKAVSGSVDLELINQIEAESSIKTTSGSVDLSVPKDMNFEIIANSSSGKFEDEIKERTYRPKHEYVSQYNNGGVTILIDTTSGSIELDSN